MQKRAAKILENVKFLAPILFVLLGVVVIFNVVAGAVYAVAGYAIKIPGLILIDIFVMGLAAFAFCPLICGENNRTFENKKIELTEPYSVSEHFARIEQTALEILNEQKPIDRTIILWWGLDGLRLNEDGSLECISRKKPAENVFYQPCQSVQPRIEFCAIPPETFSRMCNAAGKLTTAGSQVQSTRAQIDALMAQCTALQMQSWQSAQITSTIQQCCVQYPAQYPSYYYGGCCRIN